MARWCSVWHRLLDTCRVWWATDMVQSPSCGLREGDHTSIKYAIRPRAFCSSGVCIGKEGDSIDWELIVLL